jgi:hypothetical protein
MSVVRNRRVALAVGTVGLVLGLTAGVVVYIHSMQLALALTTVVAIWTLAVTMTVLIEAQLAATRPVLLSVMLGLMTGVSSFRPGLSSEPRGANRVATALVVGTAALLVALGSTALARRVVLRPKTKPPVRPPD